MNLKDSRQQMNFNESEVQTMKDFEIPYGFDTCKLGINYGDLKKVSYYSKTTGNTRNCYVLLPPDYSAENDLQIK